MPDDDKPPIMLPVNLPFVRRVEVWLWDRPWTTILLMFVTFALISSPAWFSDVWSLFSNEAPVPKIMKFVLSLPISFSWYWIPVGLGAIMLVVLSSFFLRARRRLEAENAGLKAELLQKSLPVPTPIGEAKAVHAECEKKIGRLLESEQTHATRATVHENAFKTFRQEYAVPLSVADNQKAEIGRYLEVLRVCTHDPKLDDPMPTVKWAILFKNRSVHRISLDSEVGPLFFEGHKLTEHKDVLENKVMGLYPDREGSIVFEQRLSAPEVNLLKSLPKGKFEFDKVMLYAKRSSPDAEHAPRDRVVIFSRFRAALGRCSDERSQSTEPLEAEIEKLKQQMEAAKKFDSEKAAERKALITSWRAVVASAFRDYQESGYTFTGLLATQDEYLSMTPNLSPETKTAIDATHGDYAEVRRLVNILAEDIARIEREWGL